MDIDYSVPEKVIFSMEKYTQNILEEFHKDLGETAETRVGDQLFTVWEDDTHRPLYIKQAQIFHRTVAQVLFLVI